MRNSASNIFSLGSRPSIVFFGQLLLLTMPAAFGFQPLITDDTGTQGAQGNQLEFSVNVDREAAAGNVTRTRTLPLVYTRGLSETTDVYFAAVPTKINSTIPGSDASGNGNPALGIKWRFYENEDSKTSLGFKPEIRLPISAAKEAAGLGTGRTSYGLLLILTQEVSFGAVHLNLGRGRDLFRDPEVNPHALTQHASIAPVWDLTERWKVALDAGVETETAGGVTTREQFVQFGTIFSPSKDIDFAFGIARRSDNAITRTNTSSATLGLTWRFK